MTLPPEEPAAPAAVAPPPSPPPVAPPPDPASTDDRVAPRPVMVVLPERAAQRRWTVLIRWILCLPLAVVLAVLGVAAEVLVIIGWFGALVTGHTPAFVRRFVTVYLRMSARLYAYNYLLTDRFPSFSLDEVPVDPSRIEVPEATSMRRWAVFFRVILVLPAWVLITLVTLGLQTFIVVIWVIVLVSGRLPTSMHDAYRATIRYSIRVSAYLFLLVPTYPRDLFGDEEPWDEDEDEDEHEHEHEDELDDAGAGRARHARSTPAIPETLPPADGLTVGRGASRLLVLAIALGSLYIVAGAAAGAIHAASTIEQRNNLTQASNTLAGQYNEYVTKANACMKVANPYTCTEAADQVLARHLDAYAGTLETTGHAGVSAGVINLSASDARRAARSLQVIARAGPTEAAYDRALGSSDLSSLIAGAQNSLNALDDQLNRSG